MITCDARALWFFLAVNFVFLGAHASTVFLEQLLVVLEQTTVFEVRLLDQLCAREPLGRVHAETTLEHYVQAINILLPL